MVLHDIQAKRNNEFQPDCYGFERPLYRLGLARHYMYPYNNEGCHLRDSAKSVACHRLEEGILRLSLVPHVFTT
jgi:hypothetical protein